MSVEQQFQEIVIKLGNDLGILKAPIPYERLHLELEGIQLRVSMILKCFVKLGCRVKVV